MEHTLFSTKVELLIIAIDNSKHQYDLSRLKILLDNFEIPRIILSGDVVSMDKVLEEFCSNYLKFNTDFVQKHLADVRISSGEIIITYCAVVPYIPAFNKAGLLFSLPEIEEGKIDINERYRQYIGRYGCYQ